MTLFRLPVIKMVGESIYCVMLKGLGGCENGIECWRSLISSERLVYSTHFNWCYQPKSEAQDTCEQ